MEIESKQQILERRKEIEKGLLEMLKETKSDFGLDDIKEIIYNEDGQDSLTDIIACACQTYTPMHTTCTS